jgi:hypothetical protein
MSGAPTHSADAVSRFERGFVAMSYVLGRRGAELADGLARAGAAGRGLSAALSASVREERARSLAAELLRVTAALESWRRA